MNNWFKTALEVFVALCCALLIVLLITSLSACESLPTTTPPVSTPAKEPVKAEEPRPPVVPAPTKPVEMKLAWDSKPGATEWTKFVAELLSGELYETFDSAKDAGRFCPYYYSMTKDQRVRMWAEMVVWLAYHESGWNPLSRMTETNLQGVSNPVDPITKRPVSSEGLLQLSYQDVQWAKFCGFDWSKDKNLSDKDPKKTILDPIVNLDCGLRIMARQIKNKGTVILSSGVYWAVLREGGKYSKISEITAKTKALPFCK